MAYGEGGLGKDGNRGIHGSTYAGDAAKMPDTAHDAGAFAVPSNNLLGQPSMHGSARQTLPNPSDYGRTDTASQVSGESELLGQGTTDEGLKDDEYPSLGSIPKQGMPDGAQPIDFNSVAPYEYPESQPSPKSGLTGSPATIA